MFCESCGQEVKPGEHFCTNCGAPVKEAAETLLAGMPPAETRATAPQPPAQPPHPAAPAPPVPPPGPPPAHAAPGAAAPGHSKRGLYIAVAVGGAVLVAAAIVVVLVLLLGGGGPSGVAKSYLNTAGQGNVSEAMKYVDTSYFKGDSELQEAFKKSVADSVPEGGLKFKGLKWETKVEGDRATVKVVEGKAIGKQDGSVSGYKRNPGQQGDGPC